MGWVKVQIGWSGMKFCEWKNRDLGLFADDDYNWLLEVGIDVGIEDVLDVER